MWAIQRGFFKAPCYANPILRQELVGLQFSNPLGLAAGFDKNAVALNYWGDYGFGFVECGTITYHPQEGNQRPRLFRLPADQALINRMGFNNDGAAMVAERIRESNPKIPVGINIGKSKIVELACASRDYASSFELLHDLGSYFVVNVSSPNTPGLRELQEKSRLLEIAASMKEIESTRPIFVKLSPDLDWKAIDDVIEVVTEENLAGIVATNTTIQRPKLNESSAAEGGLSGKPLQSLSDEILRYLYKHAPRGLVLMGAGGIFDGDDLFRKIGFGAHLCQIYTGWIYGGPTMVPRSLSRLVDLMQANGYTSLAELRGSLA